MDRSVPVTYHISSSLELKRYVAPRRKLPNMQAGPQQWNIALQELCRRISNGSTSEDSCHPRVPRVGTLWGGCSRMGRTKNVTSSHVSCFVGKTNYLLTTGPSSVRPPRVLRELQHSSGKHPLLSPLRRPTTLTTGVGTGAGTVIRSLRSGPLRLFVLGLLSVRPQWVHHYKCACRAVSCSASIQRNRLVSERAGINPAPNIYRK